MMKPFISGVFLLHILPLLTSAQSVHVSNSSMNISAGAFLVVPGDMYFSGNGSILNHGNIQVKGNWINNGLGLTIGPTGTTAFNGNATQVIDGGNVTSFHHMQLNNPSGVQLAIDAHTSGQLSFIDGKLTTGSEVFHIISQPPVPISGASTTRYVNGYLGAPAGTGNTFFKYEIGNTVYAPVTLNITGITVPGEIIAFTAPGAPPSENIPFANASGINQNAKVDQFWVLTPSGIQGGTATAAFEFTYTSYNGNPASYIVRKHDPANGWTSESGLLLISTMQASALSSFGEFEIGEDLNVGLNAHGEHAAGVIFPNPSDGNFTITFENNISNRFHLDLYDNTGKLVWSDTRMGISGNSIIVTAPPLNNGLYLLRAGNPAEGYHHYKLHFE